MSDAWGEFARPQPAPAARPGSDPWSEFKPAPSPGRAGLSAPPRQVGAAESAARTIGAAAIPVVQTGGLAIGGLMEGLKKGAAVADVVARVFGVTSNMSQRVQEAQDGVFQFADERAQAMRGMYNPQAGEEFSGPGQFVGGVLSAPIEIAGGFGVQRGIGRAADVVQRGGTLEEAGTAGAISGAANVAANLLPVKAGGAVGRGLERSIQRVIPARAVPQAMQPAVARVTGGAVSGAGIGAASNIGVTGAENASLPEGDQFEDLRREVDLSTSGGLGAALGGAAGLRRPAPRAVAASVPTPGTQASGGAAGTDMATMRRERAKSLPVPIELTEGQATRSFEQQQFERETAKNGKVGAPLRERFAEQNERVRQNLDALEELTGAQAGSAERAGGRVVQALADKAAAAKKKIDEAYGEARSAGDMAEPVPYERLREYIKDQSPTTREQLAPIIKMVDEQLAKTDPDGTGLAPISALEDIRQAIRKNTQYGTPNSVHGGELMKRIDAATDGAGGEKYKAARKLYSDYAAEFKSRAVVADLLGKKKGSEDRSVALENVAKRAVRGGSADDLGFLRRTLLSAGDDGRQAWRELQGQTIADIRDAALKNVGRDERGNPVVSAAALHKSIRDLDAAGKLEILFNKRGAEHLRDLSDLSKDIFTSPPGSVNHSNTASAVLNALDFSIGAGFGIPAAAATGVKALRDVLRNRVVAKKVSAALGTKDASQTGGGRNPFEGSDVLL